jgi:hypothetical protein
MALFGGLLADRLYSSAAGTRRCFNATGVPRWEWRCTRDRCELVGTKPERVDRKYSQSNRGRCQMRQHVWEAE